MITVVNGRGYDEVRDDLVEYVVALIKEHNLSQKVTTRLFLLDAWREIEKRRPFAESPEQYIAARLEEQISCYIARGIHQAAGFTECDFRAALSKLCEKTLGYFAPPAQHPIMKGEYSALLVIPTAWASIRSLLVGARTGSSSLPSGTVLDGFEEVLARGSEVTECGNTAPRRPYVLVGIDGGRTHKSLSFAKAEAELGRSGCTGFSLHELAALLLVRPEWLKEHGEMAALGERYGKDHLGFAMGSDSGPNSTVWRPPHEFSGAGVGKPYYAKRIEL